MGIFKKQKPSAVIAAAPEEPETPEEIKHMENLSYPGAEQALPKLESVPTQPESNVEYREVPVCLSQAQVNNMIIENNIMLKQIIAEI